MLEGLRNVLAEFVSDNDTFRNKLARYISPRNEKDTDEYRRIAMGYFMGGKVSPNDYLGMINKYRGWVYAAIRTITADVAAADMKLYQLVDGTRKEEVKSHEFLNFWKNPNPEFPKGFLHRLQQTYKELTGQAYWYFILNGMNKPAELWPVMPSNIKPRLDKNNKIIDYEFRPFPTGEPAYIPKEWILYEKEPNPMNFIMGYSPIYAANDPILLMERMNTYHERLFQRMARPDIILYTENGENLTPSARKRIKKDWMETYGGVENSGQPAVLEGGLKAEPFSIVPKDLEYKEGFDRVLNQIIACYGTTLDKLGLTKDVNKANAYALELIYQRNTIMPKLRDKAEWITKFVLRRYYKNTQDMFCEYNSTIPEDKELEIRENTQYAMNSILSPNEVRERIGMPPFDGGDVMMRPLNMSGSGSAVVGQGRPQTAPVTPPKQLVKHLNTKAQRLAYWEKIINRRNLFEQQYRNTLKKIFEKLQKKTIAIVNDLYKKGLKGVEWLTPPEKPFEDEIAEISKLFIKQAVVVGGNNIVVDFDLPISFDIDPDLLNLYLNERINLLKDATDQTYTHLKRILQEGVDNNLSTQEMATKIRKEFPNISKFQSNRISRTEINSAENEGYMQAMLDANVGKKMWVTAGDERVRPEHIALDGEVVLIQDTFSNGLDHPCEPNCRCAIAPA